MLTQRQCECRPGMTEWPLKPTRATFVFAYLLWYAFMSLPEVISFCNISKEKRDICLHGATPHHLHLVHSPNYVIFSISLCSCLSDPNIHLSIVFANRGAHNNTALVRLYLRTFAKWVLFMGTTGKKKYCPAFSQRRVSSSLAHCN
jgi:hypothetical protein